MIFTLGYAEERLAKFVDSGSCPGHPNVKERINEAIEQILMIEDWHLTIQKIRFFVKNNSFPLPYFAERIIACRFGRGYPGIVRSKYFEFLEGGPLSILNDGSGLQNLTDLGDNHPVMFEIPVNKSVRLVAFTEKAEDVGKTISLRFFNLKKHEVTEVIPISHWKNGVEGTASYDTMALTADYATHVISVVKPVTTGYVTLLAVDRVTKETYMIAKYHPQETNPGFHRYAIKNAVVTAEGDQTEVVALVKMRYVPAVNADDTLLVQNMSALKAMIQALRENDAGAFERGLAFKKECLWLLKQQLAKAEPNDNEFTIESDFGLGDIGSV